MVAAREKATGADDNDYDNFVEPASLILSTVIKFLPANYPDRARLLEKAENLKLPGNPLVRFIQSLFIHSFIHLFIHSLFFLAFFHQPCVFLEVLVALYGSVYEVLLWQLAYQQQHVIQNSVETSMPTL